LAEAAPALSKGPHTKTCDRREEEKEEKEEVTEEEEEEPEWGQHLLASIVAPSADDIRASHLVRTVASVGDRVEWEDGRSSGGHCLLVCIALC
jgi:hypothetical protein